MDSVNPMRLRPQVTFLMAYAVPTLGMERSALRLAEALRADHDVRIVVVKGPAPIVAGVECVTLGGRRGPIGPSDFVRLRRWAEADTSLVVAVGVWVAAPWLLAAVRGRRRTVVWDHSLVQEKIASARRLRLLAVAAKRLYGRAARVVVVSPTLKRDLDNRCGIDSIVIPNIVANDALKASGSPRARQAGFERRLLTVGSLTKTKNQAVIVRVLASLGERFSLDVAGGGPERGRLESLASELGVSSRVRFHGHVEGVTVAELLDQCDVVVHAALGETFGLAYFEAADARRPILAARNRVADELIPSLIPGRVFDTESELRRFLECDELVNIPEADFEAAASRRLRLYAIEAVVAEWRTLLADVCCRRGAPARTGRSVG